MDELSLFDLPQKSSDDSDYSANRAVGCCGRYIACSAAGHCVNQNSEIAASCLYRVNLERGKGFYGKSAFDFDPNTYRELCQKISELPADAAELLAQLSRYYFVDHYLSSNVLVYHSSALDALLPLKFFYIYQNPTQLLAKFKLKSLRDRTGLSSSEFKTRSDIVSELQANRHDLMNALLSPFCYVDFTSAQNRRYFIETFHDGIFDVKSVSPLPLPMDQESCYLKPTLKKG